jgi:hypothetical protein
VLLAEELHESCTLVHSTFPTLAARHLQDRKASHLVACLASLLDCVAPDTSALLCKLVSTCALRTMVDAMVSMRDNLRGMEALLQEVTTRQAPVVLTSCLWRL